MTLKDVLVARIAAQGPLKIAEYMSECLMHPTLGYYTTRDPFGMEGDFTTAPEISQMFGELVGLCLAQCWMDQGRPTPFTLLELGPGRGTLMADILHATRRIPGFIEAAEITLYEGSPLMRMRQMETLRAYQVTFLDKLTDLPAQPLFFVANEFFDALPVRQFIRDGGGWRERQVGLKGSELTLGLGPRTPHAPLKDRLQDTKDGDLVELMPSAADIISTLGACIAAHQGAGLVIDYGDWRSLGDTLQAVQQHKPVSILHAPGEIDLTAHVDFEALARSAPCAHSQMVPQGVFLERLGITPRAQTLAKTLTGEALENHIAAHRRLTHKEEMGNLFKVLGLFHKDSAAPAGLDI